MDIFFKDNLNSSDQLYIEQLLCASTAASTDNAGSWGITPALTDLLDADGWWFATSDPDLISKSYPDCKTYLSGCMAVYQTGDDSFECVPFVHPDLRKKGIFSSLLTAACEEGQIPGEGSVYFSCGTENKLWKNVLEHIGAEHAWDEYMMERELTEFEMMANEKATDMLYCRILENSSENKKNIDENAAEGSTAWRAVGSRSLLPQNTAQNLRADLAENPSADLTADQPTDLTAPEVTCFLAPQGDSVYLYSLEVLPELRNKHLGTAFLSVLLPQLAQKGFKTIKLQVSSENLPAMALYKKTGFCITQTLSFYEY